MRKRSLFYKKIKCGKCGGNFKSKKERGVTRYLCSNYDNGKKCKERITIEEELLIGLLNRRFRKDLTEDETREAVVEIRVKSELFFDIFLTSGEPISFHEYGIKF